MKTGKTPYEIRADLLQLAFQIVSQRYEAEAMKKALENDEKEVVMTKAPSAAEIIEEAEKLNTFVSQSSDR